MQPSEECLVELAGAILDGGAVDWTSAESSADLTERALLDQLKLVAIVADLHRRLLTESANANGELHDTVSAATVRPAEWGHLRVLEAIGRGASGEVYRAWDTRLDREVALKLLPAGRANGDARATSIIEEGRLLARVRHPNVVTIYGADRIGPHVGLWMELVKGRTLQQLIEQGRSFNPTDVVSIGIELGRAVEAVHAAGLLHRDIKPHNVMLDETGRIVLMDFGTGQEFTHSSPTLAGTPLYLAPELLDGREPTVQSDIYSLGVLLYYVLTRSYPVRANSLRDLRLAHRRREEVHLRRRRPDVSPPLARIIKRALNPRPEDRHRSVRSFAGELTRLRDRQQIITVGYRMALAIAVVLLALFGWHRSGPGAVEHESPVASSSRGLSGADGHRAQTSTAPVGTTSSTRPRSIAVLPFKPFLVSEADEQLQFEMTLAVIDQLSRVGTLRVTPVESVRSYAAANQDPLEAGRVLGVDAVIQGSVRRKAGGGLQVQAQALRTADRAALITDGAARSFGNMLEARSWLTQLLAEALELTPAEGSRIRRQDTISPEAFRHYSFGRYHLEVFNLPRMHEAEREFGEAIRLDPGYARAHAALALTLVNMVWLKGRRGLEVQESARDLALKAIDLDESVALSHTVLAQIHHYFDYAPLQAQREHLRAMELDDGDVSVLRAYSFFLLHTDAFDEALDVHRRTLSLAPASPLSNRITAEMFFVARRYEECVAECRRASTLEPNDANLMLSALLGSCLEQQGRRREAVDAWEDGRTARGNPRLAQELRRAFATGGWEGYWREIAATLGPAGHGAGAAAVYVRLGRTDEAMRALERAYESRSMGGSSNYPQFDPLRSDPRFEALLERLGLTDEIKKQLAAERAAATSRDR